MHVLCQLADARKPAKTLGSASSLAAGCTRDVQSVRCAHD